MSVTCGKCKGQIKRNAGSLVLASRVFEVLRYYLTTPQPRCYTLAQLDALPTPEPWRIRCNDCLANEEESWVYEIDLGRINTPKKAIVWLLHLQDKKWFQHSCLMSAIKRLFPDLPFGC